MECARRVAGDVVQVKGYLVSILVFMECARREERHTPPPGSDRVSILVFMECARRGLYGRPKGVLYESFNPCFYGMRS